MNTQTRHTISPSWMGMLAGLLAIVGAMSFADVAVAQVERDVDGFTSGGPHWESAGLPPSVFETAPIRIDVGLNDVLTFRTTNAQANRFHGVTFQDDDPTQVKLCNGANDDAPLHELPLDPGDDRDQCPGGTNLNRDHPGVGAGNPPRDMVRLKVVKAFTGTINFRCNFHNGNTEMAVELTFVGPPTPDPSIDSFTAAPGTINEGASSTLTYSTTDATSVDINNGVGTGLPANSSQTVSPTGNTTYTLTATGAAGTTPATASVTVTVPAMAAPAPPPAQVEVLAPDSEYSTGPGKPYYRVWYGTNRKPNNPHDESHGYSDERDSTIHYGTVIVDVPKSHLWGSVGSSWIRRWVNFTDDRLRVERIVPRDVNDFFSFMSSKLTTRVPGKKAALVYIHGFNVTFEEAAIRAAQIGYDLKVEGVTALFSWPSKGSVSEYGADVASIEGSEFYLEEFLRELALNSGADEVHLLAHSMGNRGLIRVMERLSKDQSFVQFALFGQIFLAAPDVDTENFSKLAHVYPQMSSRTTLYISSKDLALRGSGIIHDAPRAGFFPPVTVIPGIDTIRVSAIDLTILGHSYFAESAPILYDMYQLLQSDVDPLNRARISFAETANNQVFYEFLK